MSFKILTINPGSTSTKIAVFEDTAEVFTRNLSHSAEEIAAFPAIPDQLGYRLRKIMDFLVSESLTPRDFSAVVGRGGLLKPLVSGTYYVNSLMLDDLTHSRYGAHASNLGGILANLIAEKAGCPAYVVDPVVVDELDPVARITGRPEIEKRSIFHALNQKAVAKRYAKTINRPYEELNLIVAHLGGGISVGCHKRGRVVEVNNALSGDGPFGPERAGTVQAGQFAEYILNNELGREAIMKMLAGRGGLVAHLGTTDVREIEKRIAAGDEAAALIYQAMLYNIARYIAAAAVPAYGKIDQVILSGGIAYSPFVTETLKKYIGYIAPITVFPGENEMQALAEGVYRVLKHEEKAKEYL